MTELLTYTQVRERGWTPAMIRDLLGEADQTRPNPHSPASTMRLYTLTRVVEAEETESYLQRRAAAGKRADASRQSADRRREVLLAEIEKIEIRVSAMSMEELIRRACDSYNENAMGRGTDSLRATPSSDPEFLDRIIVNYLRHECTSYDGRLAALYRQVGKTDAVDLIREKVYTAIAEAYPELWRECDRQMDRRRAEP